MIDEALGRGLNQSRSVMKNLLDDYTVKAFIYRHNF